MLLPRFCCGCIVIFGATGIENRQASEQFALGGGTLSCLRFEHDGAVIDARLVHAQAAARQNVERQHQQSAEAHQDADDQVARKAEQRRAGNEQSIARPEVAVLVQEEMGNRHLFGSKNAAHKQELRARMAQRAGKNAHTQELWAKPANKQKRSYKAGIRQ